MYLSEFDDGIPILIFLRLSKQKYKISWQMAACTCGPKGYFQTWKSKKTDKHVVISSENTRNTKAIKKLVVLSTVYYYACSLAPLNFTLAHDSFTTECHRRLKNYLFLQILNPVLKGSPVPAVVNLWYPHPTRLTSCTSEIYGYIFSFIFRKLPVSDTSGSCNVTFFTPRYALS